MAMAKSLIHWHLSSNELIQLLGLYEHSEQYAAMRYL